MAAMLITPGNCGSSAKASSNTAWRLTYGFHLSLFGLCVVLSRWIVGHRFGLAERGGLGVGLFVLSGPPAHLRRSKLEAGEIRILSPTCRIRGFHSVCRYRKVNAVNPIRLNRKLTITADRWLICTREAA